MENPSKRGATTRKEHGSAATAPGDQHASSPRSKLKKKKPQPDSTERRYKDMLHTTSHIYQPGVVSRLSSEVPVEARVSKQKAQSHTKEATYIGQERIFPSGGVLPGEIIADVPLTEIMSRDQALPSAVISSENFSEESDLKNKTDAAEKNAVLHRHLENSLVDQNNQNENGSGMCRKHLSAHNDNKPNASLSRPKLCESCTVSMLSYISMLRDILDEVTDEITNQDDHSIQCAECIKERVIQRNRTQSLTEQVPRKEISQRPCDLPLNQRNETDPNSVAAYTSEQPSMANGYDGICQKRYQQPEKSFGRQQEETVLAARDSSRNLQGVQSSDQRVPQSQSAFAQPDRRVSEEIEYADQSVVTDTKTGTPIAQRSSTKRTDVFGEGDVAEGRKVDRVESESLLIDHSGTPDYVSDKTPIIAQSESYLMDHSGTPAYVSDYDRIVSGDTFSATVDIPTSKSMASSEHSWQNQFDGYREKQAVSESEDFPSQTSPFLRDRRESDGILSALSNEEREVYDSARGRAGWERLTDSQEYRDTSFGPSSTEQQEAFVTMATTNTEAISCLVLGSSLSLCNTNRTLCVLVTDGVSPSLRAPLASVFQVVQSVRSLDTVGTTKVALLDQPELGIFFRKLHVWRLAQFAKCVFLNPDTLVVQNSDELFCHEELSAVPDIGWPDCFNSGVFVFQPSVETFWKLVQFAESEGSYDGGDQGLLNAFFNTWSKDIHKKLSFIYNLMANVSYTYTPAFKQFGRNVKIVQFQGAFKPWHVKFYTDTGKIAPSTAVHPTYVQFVNVWLNIFRTRVLPLFSQDVQSYASSRNIISALELLKFYPSPVEIEPDFLLTPPSVRIRPDPLGIPRQSPIIRRHSIGSDKELKRDQQRELPDSEGSREERTCEEPLAGDKEIESSLPDNIADCEGDNSFADMRAASSISEEIPPTAEDQLPAAQEETEVSKTNMEDTEDDGSQKSSIPGSEIGDYHGMAAWEQGRMDYMGSACSENIIKRLHFLMDKPSDSEKPE